MWHFQFVNLKSAHITHKMKPKNFAGCAVRRWSTSVPLVARKLINSHHFIATNAVLLLKNSFVLGEAIASPKTNPLFHLRPVSSTKLAFIQVGIGTFATGANLRFVQLFSAMLAVISFVIVYFATFGAHYFSPPFSPTNNGHDGLFLFD